MWVSLRVYKYKGREEQILVLQWNLFVYTLFSCMYINSNHHNPFVQQGICVFLVRNHKEECVCSSCTTEKKNPQRLLLGETFEILCGFSKHWVPDGYTARMPSCQTPSTNRYTHTDRPSSEAHIHLSAVFGVFFVFALTGSRHCVCLMLVLKSDEKKMFFFFFNNPHKKHFDRHRTNRETVQHTTKQSYLHHPHPQECPPDNKSSVSDQGSCHLVVLILRQKSNRVT